MSFRRESSPWVSLRSLEDKATVELHLTLPHCFTSKEGNPAKFNFVSLGRTLILSLKNY